MMFHHLTAPEVVIWLRTDAGHYSVTPDEFTQLFDVPVPPLDPGVAQRIYEQDKRRPLIDADGNVIDGGPMPWPEADDILARTDAVMRVKQERDQEQLDKANADAKEKQEAAMAEQNARIADELKQ